MAEREKGGSVAPTQTSVPQEPAENLGTDALLAGQENNAPPPPERVPVDDLGLDELLGVDGQLAEPQETRKTTR